MIWTTAYWIRPHTPSTKIMRRSMKNTGQSMAYGPLLKFIISYTGKNLSWKRGFFSFEKRGHRYATVNTNRVAHETMKTIDSIFVKARLQDDAQERFPFYSMIKLMAAPIKKSRKPSCMKTIV